MILPQVLQTNKALLQKLQIIDRHIKKGIEYISIFTYKVKDLANYNNSLIKQIWKLTYVKIFDIIVMNIIAYVKIFDIIIMNINI